MAMKYVVTKRVFGFDKEGGEKFVVKSVTSDEIGFDKICNKVCQICGAHRGTVKLVIDGLIDVMVNDIDDGKSVRLGDFGLFRPSVRSKCANNEKEATVHNIYRKHLIFTPGKALLNTLSNMSVVKFTSPDTDYTDSGSNGGGDDGEDPTV